MDQQKSRRTFLRESVTAGVGLAMAGHLSNEAQAEEARKFSSQWRNTHDRVWLGADYWANPMQDWRIADGRLECIRPALGRSAHVLTRVLGEGSGNLSMRVTLGLLDGALAEGKGSAGFLLGVRGPLGDYRNNLVHGSGLAVGLRANGTLFIGDGSNGKSTNISLEGDSVTLEFLAEPVGERFRVTLKAFVPGASGPLLGEVIRENVPDSLIQGNLALGANFGKARPNQPNPGADRWWFADWEISGSKVLADDSRAFGPLLFTQYTLHDGRLKLSAQLPPLGESDESLVRLEVKRGDSWLKVGEQHVDPLARNVIFRIDDWDASLELPYRVLYTERFVDGTTKDHAYNGIVRMDPVQEETLTVADISCNAHYAFPNTACVESLLKLDPDLVAFTGDQYYESTAGFGVDTRSVEFAVLDVLHKWNMHGWTWRELTRDRPSLSIPDDHDVYHGNLWGDGGKDAGGLTSPFEAKGGYKMMADFVNVVHRIQTGHHPDSPALPEKQGITGYYGPLTYGRVSFAVLADRQYKSGPDGKAPPTTSGRADHVNDPNFDPKTADLPGLDLLGSGQMRFLQDWARDWRGADMKAAISQTLFTAMATHHGQKENMLVADYDTNAWPQTGRNAAVEELRRCFAFHLAGDQHLPAVVQYGVDQHRDGVFAFASPAVNNLYPRWFLPPNAESVLGDFTDSFGHPLSVLACANPKTEFAKEVLKREMDKSAGFAVVRFHKTAREVIIECWPLLADPTEANSQFPGWPVKVTPQEGRKAAAFLPEIQVKGMANPVLELIDEASGELVYSLRLPQTHWKPPVYKDGIYTVRVVEPETGKTVIKRNLTPSVGETDAVIVEVL